jgi:hypothetical protein
LSNPDFLRLMVEPDMLVPTPELSVPTRIQEALLGFRKNGTISKTPVPQTKRP